MSIYDTIVHRWLRVPYTLHVRQFNRAKRPRETIVFLHGIGDSAESWRGVAERLPDDVRTIGIDMLGFGESPKPRWVQYDMSVQARAIAHTLVKLGLSQRPIIVGHSMGSLVAIELAKRYPIVVKRLVLCSPPLYKSDKKGTPSYDKLLKDFYQLVVNNPNELEKVAPLAEKLGIVSSVFDVSGERSSTFVAALEYSIINQTSLDDLQSITMPVRILYGAFDPVVIAANLKMADRNSQYISIRRFRVGHEIMGPYVGYIASELSAIIGK